MKIGRSRPLRLSPWCHVFERQDTIALYHSLNMETAFLSNAVFNQLLQLCDGQMHPEPTGDDDAGLSDLIEQLAALGLVVTIEYDANTELRQAVERHILDPRFSIVYLLLTDRCNFACDYCFLQNNIPSGYHFQNMTADTIVRALELFAGCLKQSLRSGFQPAVILYGGEPLLNRKGINTALSRIRQLRDEGRIPPAVSVNLITNGSLVTREIAQTLAENRVSVAVSIDGTEVVHNRARRYVGGRGTFATAVRGLMLLKEAGADVGVSLTIGSHNWTTLASEVRWIIQNLGVSSMGFNMLLDTAKTPHVADDYTEAVVDTILRCWEFMRNWGIYEDRLLRKLDAFAGKCIYPRDCAGCGQQFVVSPDGQVGVCHAYTGTKKYYVGSVSSVGPDDLATHPTFVEWSRRSPLTMPECLDCPALGICGGGCPYNADTRHGSIWAVDDRFCPHAKRTLEWLIWDLYKKTSRRQRTSVAQETPSHRPAATIHQLSV